MLSHDDEDSLEKKASPAPEDGASSQHVVRTTPVPVYTCHLYVRLEPGGPVSARVGNLPEIELTAPSQREAMQQSVAAFKAAVARYREEGGEIPFAEPPLAKSDDEQEFLIPVHL